MFSENFKDIQDLTDATAEYFRLCQMNWSDDTLVDIQNAFADWMIRNAQRALTEPVGLSADYNIKMGAPYGKNIAVNALISMAMAGTDLPTGHAWTGYTSEYFFQAKSRDEALRELRYFALLAPLPNNEASFEVYDLGRIIIAVKWYDFYGIRSKLLVVRY